MACGGMLADDAEDRQDPVEGPDRRRTLDPKLGAGVSHWLAMEWVHLVLLYLAQLTADAAGLEALGRAMVLVPRTGRRRVIGSIGFHGAPDDRGRLELGCTIEPANRRQGYASEAMTSLID
jgi:RimJ/RimL family protein N-acetyltransferase